MTRVGIEKASASLSRVDGRPDQIDVGERSYDERQPVAKRDSRGYLRHTSIMPPNTDNTILPKFLE